MQKLFQRLAILLIATSLPITATAQDSLDVGYFAEWPLPAQYGQVSDAFDDALGVPTNWHAFDNSLAMFAALETGEIQIALSQGVVPFLSVANEGLTFEIVDVAVSYIENENCVVQNDVVFTRTDASNLIGRTIALPMGTTAHFNLTKQLERLNVSIAAVRLINMAPAQAAAAFNQRKVDIACAWGPALESMRSNGVMLTDTDEKIAGGGGNFDLIVTRNSFGADNPEVIAQFLKVNSELNQSFEANRTRMLPSIAKSANMTVDATTRSMAGFSFPDIDTRLGQDWMGGGVQTYLTEIANFFVQQGTLKSTLGEYGSLVNSSFLSTARDLPLIASE